MPAGRLPIVGSDRRGLSPYPAAVKLSAIEGQPAQPPDLALGAAHPPLGALDAAGGAVQCAQALQLALLLSTGEPLLVYDVGELGGRIHVGHLVSCR